MAKPTDTRYCPVCGEEVTLHGPKIERFGETFCSERHAEEFTLEVRQRRVVAAIAPETSAISESGAPVRSAWSPKRLLKWGACAAAPLVLVVLLLGGGSALGAAASSLLYLAALVACPAAMYFMMRGMRHHDKNPQASESEGDKRPEPPSPGDPGMKRPSRSGNGGL